MKATKHPIVYHRCRIPVSDIFPYRVCDGRNARVFVGTEAGSAGATDRTLAKHHCVGRDSTDTESTSMRDTSFNVSLPNRSGYCSSVAGVMVESV